MTINPPELNADEYTRPFSSAKESHRLADLYEGKIVFDSYKLEHNPQEHFKDLTLGEFDLYVSTANAFSGTMHKDYIKTEVECNRLTRHFRMVMVGLRDGMSYSEYAHTGNIVETELLFNRLNSSFGLIDNYNMTERDFAFMQYKMEDMLSYSWRIHNLEGKYKIKIWDEQKVLIGTEIADLDAALVIRKMLFKNTPIYNNWLRVIRGRKLYVTRAHPELLY